MDADGIENISANKKAINNWDLEIFIICND
jgi:hypothetical protein